MKKLFGLLWVILIGIFFIGCDSIDDTVAPIQEDVVSVDTTTSMIVDQYQEQLGDKDEGN